MKETYKPDGYNSASPYLVVVGASRTIDFLKTVFGAVEIRRFETPDGKIMHAEVKIEDSVIMLADGPGDRPPVNSNVHIYVRDVDEVYARAISSGAISIQEPAKKSDPNRRAGVKDAGGTTWWIATEVE